MNTLWILVLVFSIDGAVVHKAPFGVKTTEVDCRVDRVLVRKELLESSAILRNLRSMYDDVGIDCVPVEHSPS